jgi:hypothetical protein
MNAVGKNVLLFIVLIYMVSGFTSCSQMRTGIYKTWSFYKINTPGTIPVDDNGNVIGRIHDTSFVVYFETKKGEKPQIPGASVNGNHYKTIVTREETNEATPGNRLPDNKPVIIKAGSNRQLWKAELTDRVKINTVSAKNKSVLSLDVEYEGIKAARYIKKHTELVPELHY